MPRKRPKQPPESTTTYIDMDAERIVSIEEHIKMYGASFLPKDGAYYRKFNIKFNHRIVAAGTWEFTDAQVQKVYLILTSKPKEELGQMKRVFLGGTCNESTWRNRMMVHLDVAGMEYFNPVVDDWNDDAQSNELREREKCDFCLYTITPKMTGVYSIAEVVDDSNKRPEKTVLVLLRDDGKERFTEAQWKSLGAVAKMVKHNGGLVFDNLKHAAVDMAANKRLLDK